MTYSMKDLKHFVKLGKKDFGLEGAELLKWADQLSWLERRANNANVRGDTLDTGVHTGHRGDTLDTGVHTGHRGDTLDTQGCTLVTGVTHCNIIWEITGTRHSLSSESVTYLF